MRHLRECLTAFAGATPCVPVAIGNMRGAAAGIAAWRQRFLLELHSFAPQPMICSS